MRAWESLGGRGGGSALRLASLFTCAANSPGACLPHADPGVGPSGSRLPRAPPPSDAALIAAMGGRAATRLQSEWAAEIYWGLRGDASVIGDLLVGAGRPNAGGDKAGVTQEMQVLSSEKFWVNWLLKSQKGATCSQETSSN